jgi:hypothetical protein
VRPLDQQDLLVDQLEAVVLAAVEAVLLVKAKR